MVIAHNKFATSFRESKEYKIAHAAKVEAARKLEESKRANKIMLDKAQEKLAALSAEELAAIDADAVEAGINLWRAPSFA